MSALKGRLHQLLQEWPEHPVLVQLLAICHRLTGLVTSPVPSWGFCLAVLVLSCKVRARHGFQSRALGRSCFALPCSALPCPEPPHCTSPCLVLPFKSCPKPLWQGVSGTCCQSPNSIQSTPGSHHRQSLLPTARVAHTFLIRFEGKICQGLTGDSLQACQWSPP